MSVRPLLCVGIDGKWVDVECPGFSKEGQKLGLEFWLLVLPAIAHYSGQLVKSLNVLARLWE